MRPPFGAPGIPRRPRVGGRQGSDPQYREVREVFELAEEAARAAGSGVSADHLALGILRSADPSGATVLRELQIGEQELAGSPDRPGGTRRGWGPQLQPIIQAAAEEAWRMGSRLTRSAHLVLGLAASGQGALDRLLAARGVTLDALRERVGQAIAATPRPEAVRSASPPPPEGGMGQGLFTVDQAAQFLGIHHQTLRGYIKSGKLPAYRLAGEKVLRIKRDDLLALLEPVAVGEVADEV